MKTIILVILSVILLTSCGKNNEVNNIVTEAINSQNRIMGTNDEVTLVSIDTTFTIKDVPYFNVNERDTSKIIIKGHKDAMVILTTVKQHNVKTKSIIVYDIKDKRGCVWAITSDKEIINQNINNMKKSDIVQLTEYKENVQFNNEYLK